MDSKRMIYVIDDDKCIRESLDALLAAAGYNVQIFAEPRAFMAFARPDVPSCLILDLNLGDTTGLDLQDQLAGEPVLAVIFLTGFGDIRTTVKAMRRGASEFLSKPVEEEQLLPAIEAALAEAELRWAGYLQLRELRRRYKVLTPREREVLPYIVHGFLNKQTAYELGTSEITIRIHRSQIMRKMKADSLAGLVRMAGRLGFLSD